MFNLNKHLLLNKKTDSLRRATSTIMPNTTSKVFLPNPNKKFVEKKPNHPTEINTDPRYNEIGIQMLSSNIYNQVFIEKNINKHVSFDVIENCKKDLIKHHMVNKQEHIIKNVEFKIPPLQGNNIEEHFKIIGEEQAKPYRDLINQLLVGIPQPPANWLMQEGWTRYEVGFEPQKVDYPLEEVLVFDVEVSTVF